MQWEPARPNWEGILGGRVNELQLTATNYGFIAAENVTLSWPKYYYNVEFILPDLEVDENGNFILGTLPANSTYTVTIGVKQLAPSFDIPEDSQYAQYHRNGVIFSTTSYVGEEDAVDMVVALSEDPIGSRIFIRFKNETHVDFFYDNSTSTLIRPVYSNGDIIDTFATYNTSFPSGGGRQLALSNRALEQRNPLDSFLHCLAELGWFYLCDKVPLLGYACMAISAAKILMAYWLYFCAIAELGDHDFEGYADKMEKFSDVADGLAPFGPCYCRNTTCYGSGGGDYDSTGPVGGSDVFIYIYGPSGGGGTMRNWGDFDCDEKKRRRLSGSRRELVQSSYLPRYLEESTCPTCSDADMKAVYDELGTNDLLFQSIESKVFSCVDRALTFSGIKSIYPCILVESTEVLSIVPLAKDVSLCEVENIDCYGDLSERPGQQKLLTESGRMLRFMELILLPFGGLLSEDSYFLANATVPTNLTQLQLLRSTIVNSVADESESGRTISIAELRDLIGLGFHVPSQWDFENFADTWNRSIDLWDNGILSREDLPSNYTLNFFDLSEASDLMNKFVADRYTVKREGYSGITEAWQKAVEGQAFEEARRLAGVCASVHVRIEQELTLTRTGFEARLEILNSGTSPLTNVSVVLSAYPFNNFEDDATDLFAFDDPVLDDLTSIDGSGRIEANGKAQATWLMIPLTAAAPQFSTTYDISGILSYYVDGIEYIQYLAPDMITVLPDPQLYLTYFHSRNAYSDDPFTPEIEPSLPYQLGLLIENRGYGDARDVKIVSSQPEIIDNKKGLLVDFEIIGSRLDDNPTYNSLQIEFGNIEARTNSIGVWDIVSFLRGTFKDLSVTFEYKGPIDDDRLSLIKTANIYELTHIVRVTGDHPAMPNSLGYVDDGLDDFLANVIPDAFYLPDTVFTSDTRSSNFSVAQVVDSAVVQNPVEVDGLVSVIVEHTPQNIGLLDWAYVRFDDPMANTDFILQKVTRTDVNYTLISGYNSWQTSWTEYLTGGQVDELDYIHLFDYGVASEYILHYSKQQPVKNLRVIDQANQSLTIAWDYATGASSSYVIFKPFSMTDEYFKAAISFTQINTLVINGLQSATEYVIRVFTGKEGKYEKTGATIITSTLGVNYCGNGILDIGEECDNGFLENGAANGNCTASCLTIYRQDEDSNDSVEPTASPTTQSPTSSNTQSTTTQSPTSSNTQSTTTQSPTSSSTSTQSPTTPPTDETPSPDDKPNSSASLGGGTTSICHKPEYECGSPYIGHTMHKYLDDGKCISTCAYFTNFRLDMGWYCGPCEEGTRFLQEQISSTTRSSALPTAYLRH